MTLSVFDLFGGDRIIPKKSHRIILKKVTFNVTLLVTVFKSDEKCDDKCNDSFFLNGHIEYSTIRYGTVR